jgi:hypothetical protein
MSKKPTGKKKSNVGGRRLQDHLNKNALAEAERFNKRVNDWRNDPRYEDMLRYNGMTSQAYMEEICKRGYPTELSEEDFHQVQETTFWHNQALYLKHIVKETEILLSIQLELLKVRKPEEYEKLMQTIDENTVHEDVSREQLTEQKRAIKGERKMGMVDKMNPREKTEFMAINTAAQDAIFKNLRTINEVQYALYAAEIEEEQNRRAYATKEQKVENPAPKVADDKGEQPK